MVGSTAAADVNVALSELVKGITRTETIERRLTRELDTLDPDADEPPDDFQARREQRSYTHEV